MKYFFKRDTIFATISVFLVMWLLLLLPLNMHILDPLRLAFSDVRFNDLSFSALKSHDANAVNDKIIIVNIGKAGRREIAALINRLNTAHPVSIGLDVLFNSPRSPGDDSLLQRAIRACPNIVLSDKIDWEEDKMEHNNYFANASEHSGYVNFIGEKRGAIRYFSPFEKWKDSLYLSFPAAVIKQSSDIAFKVLERRKSAVEMINYKRKAEQFFIIDYRDMLNDKIELSVFKDKIALIGYVSENQFDIEDKHFTPLNEKFAGKSIPDMNGVIIHANIISMVLAENYINELPSWLTGIVTFILTWIFMSFIIHYYIERHIWFHLAAKTVQVLLMVLLVYAGIFFIRYLDIYIGFTALLVAIVLSVDVLYFYEGLSLWLNKRFSYKTIFNKTKH